jgi:hypothetical protein
MYTVKEIDGMFYVVKGEKVISIGYHFEPEAWEKIKDLELMDRYRRSGVPKSAVSEAHEEKLERDFLDLFMRLVVYGFVLFGFMVALYGSIAWITS